MIKLKKPIEYLVAGGVALLAVTGSAPAQAVSLVSTYRPPGTNTAIGKIDSMGNYSSALTGNLKLNDIAVNSVGALYGVTDDQLYRLNTIADPTVFSTSYDPIHGPDLKVNGTQIVGLIGLGFDDKNDLYGIAGCNSSKGCEGEIRKDKDGNPLPGGAGKPAFYKINPLDATDTKFISDLGGYNIGGYAPSAFTTGGDAGDIVFNRNTGKFLATAAARNPDGSLNLADTLLFSIDPTTGTPSSIGNILGARVSGLTFDGSSLLGYTTDRRQLTIDPNTGAVTGSIGLAGVPTNGVNGALQLIGGAESKLAPTSVPEPSSTAGMVVLGSCLGIRAMMKRRKQLEI